MPPKPMTGMDSPVSPSVVRCMSAPLQCAPQFEPQQILAIARMHGHRQIEHDVEPMPGPFDKQQREEGQAEDDHADASRFGEPKTDAGELTAGLETLADPIAVAVAQRGEKAVEDEHRDDR